MDTGEVPYVRGHLGRVPQLDSFKDWDPLTDGEESDWENGGRFGTRQSADNVTHLDTAVGLQITASVMVAVGEDNGVPESTAGSGSEE